MKQYLECELLFSCLQLIPLPPFVYFRMGEGRDGGQEPSTILISSSVNLPAATHRPMSMDLSTAPILGHWFYFRMTCTWVINCIPPGNGSRPICPLVEA